MNTEHMNAWTLEFKYTSTQEWEQKNKRSKNKRILYEGGGDDNEVKFLMCPYIYNYNSTELDFLKHWS